MESCLGGKTEYVWHLCMDKDNIADGLGVIENDLRNRKELTPNISAAYTEAEYRCKGIAGRLLNMAEYYLRGTGISPVYLLTDHSGFYKRYG